MLRLSYNVERILHGEKKLHTEKEHNKRVINLSSQTIWRKSFVENSPLPQKVLLGFLRRFQLVVLEAFCCYDSKSLFCGDFSPTHLCTAETLLHVDVFPLLKP